MSRSALCESWAVAVVIPARNEEDRITQCLESVLAALEISGAAAWIVVSADSCTDRTGALARSVMRGRGEVIACDVGSPGAARRIGTAMALSHFGDLRPERVWLAHTDADSVVPQDWIIEHLNFAVLGMAGVAGIVEVDSFEGHGPEGAAIFLRHYGQLKEETHGHVHGANLGVRADAYLRAGGWTALSVGEDHCLWRRLKACGSPLLASTRSVVTTSGRLHGRARGGFADGLASRLLQIHRNV